MYSLIVILALIGVIIIFVSLLMSPDSNAYSGALVGSSDLDLFRTSKELGFKKFLKILMFCLGILLLLIAALMVIYQ